MRYASMVSRVSGSGTEKWELHFQALTRRTAGDEILMLTIGEPDVATPTHILDATVESLHSGRTGYSVGRGERALLAAISDHYLEAQREVTQSQIIITSGTQNALAIAMFGLVESGDEVLVPDPYYATYEGVILSAGAELVPVPLDPDQGFHLDAEALRRKVTPTSRVLLLNSPHNPTGATLSLAEIEDIGQVCVDHNLWIVSDEVYSHHAFDGTTAASPLDVAELVDRTIVVSSLSKSHAMPGFRAGWLIGSEQAIGALLPIAESMLFGTQPFVQDAAAVALRDDMSITKQMREMFIRRAEVMTRTIDGAGAVRCSMPEAGMFVMADVRGSGLSGVEFATRLLEEESVGVMPGESFGLGAAGHIRISLTVADDIVSRAADRIAAFARRLSSA